MTTELWSAYVRAVATRGGERQQDIAERVGVSQAAISRWLTGAEVPNKPAVVAAFAKAHDRNVLEAFIAAGMLEEADAGRGLPATSKRFLTQVREERQAEEEYRRAQAKLAREASVTRVGQVSPKAVTEGGSCR